MNHPINEHPAVLEILSGFTASQPLEFAVQIAFLFGPSRVTVFQVALCLLDVPGLVSFFAVYVLPALNDLLFDKRKQIGVKS